VNQDDERVLSAGAETVRIGDQSFDLLAQSASPFERLRFRHLLFAEVGLEIDQFSCLSGGEAVERSAEPARRTGRAGMLIKQRFAIFGYANVLEIGSVELRVHPGFVLLDVAHGDVANAVGQQGDEAIRRGRKAVGGCQTALPLQIDARRRAGRQLEVQ